MKRTDITDLFPDATKEQIDKLLGINGADINSAKGDLTGLQGQLADAQKQIEKLQQGSGQSDQLAAANKAIKDLQAELKGMKDAESLRQIRDKVAADKKVPAKLLTGDTEEACAAQADSILAFAQSHGYPGVPDAGEANHHASGDKTVAGYAKLSADLFGNE